ncbi:hypothetical protein [Rossellomorea sp. LjRoot5]|uniref:hypothetical protein n=1 Tax=Rossellomorea sp. LjRoot5 TaxID=3342331 RepID=UPI003ECCF5B1
MSGVEMIVYLVHISGDVPGTKRLRRTRYKKAEAYQVQKEQLVPGTSRPRPLKRAAIEFALLLK